MIYYFTTYHRGGLGHAKNAICRIVPDTTDGEANWIGLIDADVMLFPTHWGTLVSDAIRKNPNFSAFCCRANRCHNTSQQLVAHLKDEPNLIILKHAATEIAAKHGTEVEEITTGVSGFFLLFPKSLWKTYPFPVIDTLGRRNLGIETDWIRVLRRDGHKIGMLKGLMAVHYYRMDTNSRAHLT